MFSLYFMGAEVPGWRTLLAEEGAKHQALTYFQLERRLPKKKRWTLADNFPDDVSIMLDSGAVSAGKKGATRSPDEWVKYLDAYLDFVEDNLDRINLVTEFDSPLIGRDLISETREEFWDHIAPEKFVPVWHEEYGLPELERLAQRYDHVGIPNAVLQSKRSIVAKLNGLVVRYGVELHGLAITKPDVLLQVNFASASSTSWLSPMEFGDTIVWDGTRLRRYPQKMKEQARRRHRSLFEKVGFDAEKIANDEPNEVARFTLWSWLQFEEAVAHRRGRKGQNGLVEGFVATTDAVADEHTNGDVATDHVAMEPYRMGNVQQRPDEEKSVLPVFGVRSERTSVEQGGNGEPIHLLVTPEQSLRQCNTCYVATTCPAMKPDHACSFAFPVEIRTGDQVKAACRAILEMQLQRVGFGRYSEELEGGYPDTNVSVEMDRFFKMVEAIRTIEDPRDFLKISVEGRAQSGVLSRLFGEGAGQRARELPEGQGMNGEATDQLLKDVVDADVVEEVS